MGTPRSLRLLAIAQELAVENGAFHTVLGPGDGNRATNSFIATLRTKAKEEFGSDFAEQKICGSTSQAVDFYFPQEATIVEIALGLPNPGSEFEKDVLKAIIAQDCGFNVKRLRFISRPGAIKKCAQPRASEHHRLGEKKAWLGYRGSRVCWRAAQAQTSKITNRACSLSPRMPNNTLVPTRKSEALLLATQCGR